MLDSDGELIWQDASFGIAADLKVQSYRGQHYLTFWHGVQAQKTFGKGYYAMLDESYRVYKTIFATSGFSGDLHEFQLTQDDTALITIYEAIPADLSPFGIHSTGWIQDCIFQEINIETNSLLFEWRASQHFEVTDTFATPQLLQAAGTSPLTPFDFFHINSVQKTPAGHYIVSSRYLKAIFCVDTSGHILWSLGGKQNSFTDLSSGNATNFEFQHHARLHFSNRSNDTALLSLFDNARADRWSPKPDRSRGMLISLDLSSMTATLVQEYPSPFPYGSQSQGSFQILPDSNTALIGWGSVPAYTEYNLTDGTALCHTRFAPSLVDNLGWITSYRVHRTNHWVGRPLTRPAIHVSAYSDIGYVSWNGATEIEWWVLQATDTLLLEGRAEEEEENMNFIDIDEIQKQGFETSFVISDDMPQYIRMRAVDFHGKTLGYTIIVDRFAGTVEPSWLERVLQILILAVAGSTTVVIVIWKWKSKPWRLWWKLRGRGFRAGSSPSSSSPSSLRSILSFWQGKKVFATTNKTMISDDAELRLLNTMGPNIDTDDEEENS